MMNFRNVLLGFFLFVFQQEGLTQSNPQDCIGAIPVCSAIINNPTSYLGSGDIPNEINSTSSCIGGGEVNSVWYALTIQTAGDLGFLLNPNTPTDYDWAVFNLTNATCADIFTDPAIMVSCNFAPVTTSTGPNGTNAPGIGFNSFIPVQAGETYIIFINNYGGANSGFQLDFTMSTAQIFDNDAPSVLGLAEPLVCNASSVVLQLSEPIACNSLTNNMFTISGPDGNVPVTSITCQGGGAYSNEIVINLGSALVTPGNYTATLANGSISDLCGNALTPGNSAPVPFAFQGISLTDPVVNPSLCYAPTGSISVTVQGGTGTLNFAWSPAGGPNASTWNNIPGGNYTLTVTDANGCSGSESFVVPELYDFSISTTQTPDTCLKGVGRGELTINGTSGPFTIEWLHDGGTNAISDSLTGDSTYVVAVTDMNNCTLFDTLFVSDIRNDSLLAEFSFFRDTVDILLPIGQAINESDNFSSFLWLFPPPNDADSTNMSPYFELENGGFWPVSLIVRDQNGCTDTLTKEIYVAPQIYYYIPNAFTPNGNMRNEIWKPSGIGFDTTSFFMRIYNRWGELVYTTADHKEGWDGTDLKGRACPADTYVYRITMEGMVLEHYGDFKGFVILIR